MKSPHITFVACNSNAAFYKNDPSFVYRCENIGLALSEQDFRVEFIHLSSLGQKYPALAVVFHRPQASFRLWRHIHRLRRQGVIIIADVDDLVFDPTYTDYSPGVLNGQVSKKVTGKRFRSHQRAFSWFDGITVSTVPLANYLNKLLPKIPVEVIPNCIHKSWRKSPIFENGHNPKKILTYFPGTHSHNRDFNIIQEPLRKFLSSNPDVKLNITGPLDFDLQAYSGQVNHLERVPYEEYHRQFQSSWVNLAPLENTPFNQCKSALKVIEAGYWGIPTLCSPNPDFRRFIKAGAVLSENETEWLSGLEGMLAPENYNKITKNLSSKTISIADINKQARRYTRFLHLLKQSYAA